MVLDYCKSEPEFFLCVIFCVCLGLRLLHLAVAQILYTIISYLYMIYLLLKFLHVLTEFNTAFGSCGCFNLPIVRSQRQLILKHTLVCSCIALFLGSLLCLRSTVGSTECGHSALNCTPRHAPASRYIVAFKVNNSPQLLTDFRKIFRGVTNSLKMNCYGIDFDKVAITRMKPKRAFNDDSHNIIITKIGQRTQEIQGFKCKMCRYSSL